MRNGLTPKKIKRTSQNSLFAKHNWLWWWQGWKRPWSCWIASPEDIVVGARLSDITHLVVWFLGPSGQVVSCPRLSSSSNFWSSSLSGPGVTRGTSRQREQRRASHYHSIQLHFYPEQLAKLIKTGQQWSHIPLHAANSESSPSESERNVDAVFFCSDSWRSFELLCSCSVAPGYSRLPLGILIRNTAPHVSYYFFVGAALHPQWNQVK